MQKGTANGGAFLFLDGNLGPLYEGAVTKGDWGSVP